MAYVNKTKQKIIDVSWALFLEKGFEKTTVEDILKGVGISKGTFYHYFSGKDALLSTLADVLDEFYRGLYKKMDPEMNSVDKLILACSSCNRLIEETVDFELLATLYSSQAAINGDRHMLDTSRYNFTIVREFVAEGQSRKQIRTDIPAYKIEHYFLMCVRALIYDYCIFEASYNLEEYTLEVLPHMLEWIREPLEK